MTVVGAPGARVTFADVFALETQAHVLIRALPEGDDKTNAIGEVAAAAAAHRACAGSS